MSEVLSVRLPSEVARRLRERAPASGQSVSALAQRLIDEGLRMEAHPGIVFRSGPTGRRAGVLGGPDVWQVVDVARSLQKPGERGITDISQRLDIEPRLVRAALRYHSEFPDEVDARITANEQAQERVRREADHQKRLLG